MKNNRIDPQLILKIFNQHSVNSFRTQSDIQNFLNIPQSQVYTAWDSAGNIKAFAVEGKGIDLNGYLHEWGGGVKELLALFSYIVKDQKRDITLITPPHSQNLIQQLKFRGVNFHQGFLGLIKILDKESFFPKLVRYIKSFGYQNVEMTSLPNQSVFLRIDQHEIEIKDEKNLVRLLFGPFDGEFFEKLSPEFKNIISVVFPLKIWIWGWDSI